mmetsp:Transcript_121297/g.314901  ORF Transcript_121297/g.314901 Transcript_121297/m.314901 type:complete len:349 (+) Transcript_121297:84-1130(+)
MATQEGEAGQPSPASPREAEPVASLEDEDESAGESMDLADEEEGMDAFEHHESIYSFMILYPELNRIKYGSYWNSKVALSFALFFLNLLMQISLTHITGESILEDNLAFRQTLVSQGDILADVAEKTLELKETLEDLVDGEGEEDHCCRGPHCAGGEACCAPRSLARTRKNTSLASTRQLGRKQVPAAAATTGHLPRRPGAAAAASRAAASLAVPGNFLAKPGGGKGKKEGAEGDNAQGTVCIIRDKEMDCSQPSFAFLDRWHELDYNGDGNWTYEEAVRDDANLGCFLANTGLTPEAVFRSFCRGITKFYPELAGTKDTDEDRRPYRDQVRELVPLTVRKIEAASQG